MLYKTQSNGVSTDCDFIPRSLSTLQLGELHMSNASVEDAMTNDREQPVDWVRIVVLAAVALPALAA
jgi:hypothetical protein